MRLPCRAPYMRNPRTKCASSRGPLRGPAPPTPADPNDRVGARSRQLRPKERRGRHPVRHPRALARAAAAPCPPPTDTRRSRSRTRSGQAPAATWPGAPIPAPAGDSPPSALRAWGRPHKQQWWARRRPLPPPAGMRASPQCLGGLGGTPRAMGVLPARARPRVGAGAAAPRRRRVARTPPGPHRRRCLSRPTGRQFTASHTPRTAGRSASPPSARAPAPDQSRP